MITKPKKDEYWLTRAQYEARKQAGTLVDGAVYNITDDEYAKLTAAEYVELATMLASEFSTSVTYWVGQFVTRSGHTYECITQHTGAWNASHFSLLV